MSITKHNYIVNSLKKIRHKKWEVFVITRILHGLDDDDIEFVTQQYVRRPDGEPALTDLYFPQFKLHVEVDEPPHEEKEKSKNDERRKQDIIQVTGHDFRHVKIGETKNEYRPLKSIRNDIDGLIKEIKARKEEAVRNGNFIPWDFDLRYSSAPVINRGYLSIDDNVVFKLQVEALRCFGFKGKGCQRGAWTIPDGSNDEVWFPRLYQHGIWHNELVDDGKVIYERASSEDPALKEKAVISIAKQRGQWADNPDKKYIVFAKARDALGFDILRYVGSFQMNFEEKAEDKIRFDRVSTQEAVRYLSG